MTFKDDTQSRLLTAILSGSDNAEFERRGLEAYQRNFAANASRALSISFPVVFQLLGDRLFSKICQLYSRHSAPTVGDWAEWGADFPEWLLTADISRKLPYLSDCAELDWVYHQCQRSENPQPDFDSFQMLSSSKAGEGHLLCNPTLTPISSSFPIFDLWNAHNSEESERSLLLQIASNRLTERSGQTAIVWRKHWRTIVRPIAETERIWLSLLLTGLSIEEALESMNNFCVDRKNEPFAFEHWLPDAIENHIVIGFSGFEQ